MFEYLKRHFSNQKNLEYIISKTEGSNQALKIYEILCIIENPNLNEKDKSGQIKAFIKNDQLLWLHPIFKNERIRIEEENDFMVNPYEISEGVLTCGKCNCKKIFSFSKQTRSMDEPMTVFCFCSQCNHKWCEGS